MYFELLQAKSAVDEQLLSLHVNTSFCVKNEQMPSACEYQVI